MSASRASETTAPLAVEDILAQLVSHHPAPHNAITTDVGSSSRCCDKAQPCLTPSLPLPAAVASQHRVQVCLRGRRYETTMAVATTYCLAFHLFFHSPFTGAMTVGDVAVAEVGDGAAGALSEAALMTLYVHAVEPVLHTFLQHQQQNVDASVPHASAASDVHGSSEEDAAFVPPALPRPMHIAYDATGKLWKFEFPPRLTAAEEAAERSRRQRLHAATSGNATEKHITTDELNASPFLLLQNDFMGLLLVYLRRCAKARAEGTAYPTLPIRWAEMGYDDQIAFLQLLRTFGVVPLTSLYQRPTASLSTSQFVGADAANVAAAAKAEGDACSLLVKAEEFRLLQLRQQHEAEMLAAKRASERDDEDGVVLAATGCVRCGMAGHAVEACPY